MRARAKRRSTPKRPHRVPPPLSLETESLDGMPILRESAADLGLLLWQTIRGVELWASLPESERGEAFSTEAYAERVASIRTWEIPVEVVGPVTAAASVLRGGEAGKVVSAMRELAGWAEETERPGTALAAMRTAARCASDDAELAFETGRLAWATGDRGMAEMWFRQAITRARRTEDRMTFANGYLALTSVLIDRGSIPMAKKTAVRALRITERYSLHELRGVAHHTMAGIAIAEENDRASLHHARLALRYYEPRHPRLPMLASDLAYRWLLKGYFQPAAVLFQAVQPLIERPRERLFLYANLARTAAGAGDEALFETARDAVRALASSPGNERWEVDALLEVAHGAVLLGRHGATEALLLDVIKGAELVGKHQVRHHAEVLLDTLRSEQAAAEFRLENRRRNPPRQISALATELADALPAAAR